MFLEFNIGLVETFVRSGVSAISDILTCPGCTAFSSMKVLRAICGRGNGSSSNCRRPPMARRALQARSMMNILYIWATSHCRYGNTRAPFASRERRRIALDRALSRGELRFVLHVLSRTTIDAIWYETEQHRLWLHDYTKYCYERFQETIEEGAMCEGTAEGACPLSDTVSFLLQISSVRP